jgi:hypothetical protein
MAAHPVAIFFSELHPAKFAKDFFLRALFCPTLDGQNLVTERLTCRRRRWHLSRERMEKDKPYVHRERFSDTGIKQNQTWQCVASQARLIAAK